MDNLEYDESDQSTWKVRKPPSRPDWFDKELLAIGGLNRLGRPNLKLVWGGSESSDKTADNTYLKYHAGWTPQEVKGYRYQIEDEWHFTSELESVPESIMVYPDMQREELGLLRWVIEKWTPPETLENQRRFSNVIDPDDNTRLLRQLPRSGVYDVYFIVESADGKYRPIERDVVDFIRWKWHQDKKTFDELECEREQFNLADKESKLRFNEEIRQAAVNFDLRLPPEERDRREHYWATKHDYEREAERIAATVTSYRK